MTDPIGLARRATMACALVLLALAGAASAAPVSVNLRVEGRTQTIFDAPVTTDGHDVTTQSGGTHECDGTNGPTPEPEPGATATSALDDAARRAGFSFDGTYSSDPAFPDFFISRIAGDTRDESSEYWSLWIDYSFASEGGCQQRVRQGDDVLWGLSSFSDDRALKLSGPTTATTGQPVQVKVASGASPAGEPGAQVGGATTGPDGTATVSFSEAGVYRLKAEKVNAVRSNSLVLCVDPAGADPCTSTDRAAPAAQVLLPRFASERSRSRTFVVAWQGTDGPTGSGVSGFSLDGRDLRSIRRKTLIGRSAGVSTHFRGRSGHSYEFRVSAFDRANNRGRFATGKVTVPIDDRDRVLRFSRGWRRLASRQAWGRKLVRSQEAGATVRLRFRGRRVALIGRKLRNGGRLLVSVDGHRKRLRLRGRPRQRSLLYLSAPRRSGRHSLRLQALGDGPVEIDAVAPVS
jgi:hypothetical protein